MTTLDAPICIYCKGTGRAHTKQPLTRQQQAVYAWIADYVNSGNGESPTYEEIKIGLGFRALSTVHEHVHSLRRKGWVSTHHNSQRSIQLL